MEATFVKLTAVIYLLTAAGYFYFVFRKDTASKVPALALAGSSQSSAIDASEPPISRHRARTRGNLQTAQARPVVPGGDTSSVTSARIPTCA